MRKLTFLLTCLFLVGVGLVNAQSKSISGKVLSADDGQPVIGATVRVKGTTVGTITNADGEFKISLHGDAKNLTVSYVGMNTAEVQATNGITVKLQSNSKMIDEVVVVGYGSQKKKDLTSSIAKVSGQDISNLATASFDTQLAGRAAGVQVSTSNGVLGSAATFKIRGFSTITSGNQPLIIIDGMPVNSGQLQQLYTVSNPMSDINPNDIQSIEVLKDGAATAIYGSRAANGVVLITTKKGNKGAIKVTYDGYVGFASATKTHDLLNAKDFVTIANEKKENWGDKGDAVYDPNGPNTKWNDYIFQTGLQHSHTVGASGGTEKSQYYVSAGYTNQDGIVRNNNLERYTVKADLTQQANKWLKIGINAQVTNTITKGVMNEENSLGSVGFAGVRMLPNVSVYDATDVTGYNIDKVNRKTLGRGSNLAYVDNGIQNIVWALDQNVNRTKNNRIITGGFAEIALLDGLTLRTQVGIDNTQSNDYMYWSAESGDGYGSGGTINEVNTSYINKNWQNILSFNKTFNSVHNLSATAVQEYTHTQYEWTLSDVSKLSDSFFSDHIITGTFGVKDISGSKTYNGLASYLLRANYNYDSKYYLGASIRRDGLSRLPVDTRWGTFWGSSAAWRISKESFWNQSSISSWFNDLRLRGSYATIGNSELGSNNFPYLGTYSAKQYGSQTGIAWSNMGNNKLKWETTETFDLGLDGSLFNGRLTFELAYWQKNSKDLVLEVPTASSLGIPGNTYYDNVGKVKNSGFELSFGADIVAQKDFKWHSDLNFSTVKNTVKSLYGGSDIVDNYTIIREGESYRSLYGYNYYGVNKVNGNPIWTKADGSLVQFDTFGSYDYVAYDPKNPADVSKSSSLDASDRKLLGSTLPTWYGGFNNTLTYKSFDLNIFVRFSGGNKIMNGSRQSSLLNMEFANNGTEILGRWQSEAIPGDGMTPRIAYGEASTLFNDRYTDSHFVENGSYLKLANLSLGYTLPKNIISKLDLSKVRLYLQAQNLLTITGYSGLDPETSTRTGVDWDGLPQQKVFSIGANITF
jgi:TonB-dependent starch-binding outer membrane protein SusC